MLRLKILEVPLGMGIDYMPRKKEWIGAAIGAAMQVGSAIYGGKKSAEAEEQARRMEAMQKARNDAYFNRRLNESYADTAAGRNIIRKAREYADDNWKKAQGAAAVGGATDASTAMAKEAGNRVVADTLSNVAAQDTARRDSIENQKFAADNQYAQHQAQLERQHGANVANVASQMGNALGGIASAVEGAVVKANTPAETYEPLGGGPINAPSASDRAALQEATQNTYVSDALNPLNQPINPKVKVNIAK